MHDVNMLKEIKIIYCLLRQKIDVSQFKSPTELITSFYYHLIKRTTEYKPTPINKQ